MHGGYIINKNRMLRFAYFKIAYNIRNADIHNMQLPFFGVPRRAKEVPQGLKKHFDRNFLIKPAHTTVWCQNSRIRNLPHALDRRSTVELALALMCDIRVF